MASPLYPQTENNGEELLVHQGTDEMKGFCAFCTSGECVLKSGEGIEKGIRVKTEGKLSILYFQINIKCEDVKINTLDIL